MPNTDDLQEAVDDLGAQLEATFANRAAAASEGDDGDGADPPAGAGDQPDGDEEPAEGEQPPAAGEGEDPPADPSPSAGSDLDEAGARRLLDWAQNLPGEVREQFRQIETGTHHAVPRHEFEAYQRWLQGQQAPPAPAGAQAPSFENLTPEQQAYVRALQNDYERLEERQRQLTYEQQQAGLGDTIATIDAASKAYAEKRGLDEQTLAEVQAHAAALQIFPQLVEAARVYNPATGALLRDADYGAVVERAFDLAMLDHPELRNRAYEAEVTRRLEAQRTASHAADGKRAKASSLASVPSAALTRDPHDSRPRSAQEQTAAIAEHIRKTQNGVGV